MSSDQKGTQGPRSRAHKSRGSDSCQKPEVKHSMRTEPLKPLKTQGERRPRHLRQTDLTPSPRAHSRANHLTTDQKVVGSSPAERTARNPCYGGGFGVFGRVRGPLVPGMCSPECSHRIPDVLVRVTRQNHYYGSARVLHRCRKVDRVVVVDIVPHAPCVASPEPLLDLGPILRAIAVDD